MACMCVVAFMGEYRWNMNIVILETVMTERGTMSEFTSPTDMYGVGSCGLLKNDNDVCCERRENIINGLLMSEGDFPRRMDAVW